MTTYLDELVAAAHVRVRDAQRADPLIDLKARAESRPPAAPFADAVGGEGVAVVAEIKRASPSRGPLAEGLDALDCARGYAEAGAAAISVLTEPERFQGSLEDLRRVSTLAVPTLRKDFLVDEYQVWEARDAGASAVLLIVAVLGAVTLEHLLAVTVEAGLDALVEVHDEEEAVIAGDAGARVVGINARDLRSFEVDPGRFAAVRHRIGDGIVAVAESGISSPADVRRLAAEGADAVLVGEALVTARDPRAALRALVAAGGAKLPPADTGPHSRADPIRGVS